MYVFCEPMTSNQLLLHGLCHSERRLGLAHASMYYVSCIISSVAMSGSCIPAYSQKISLVAAGLGIQNDHS